MYSLEMKENNVLLICSQHLQNKNRIQKKLFIQTQLSHQKLKSMISSSKHNIKSSKKHPTAVNNQPIHEKSNKTIAQCGLTPNNKIKPRLDRSKPLKIQEIKNLNTIQHNNIHQNPLKSQDSSVFSKNDKEKIKISIKKSDEYHQKVNQNGFSKFPPTFTQLLPPTLIISMTVEVILVSLENVKNFQIYVVFGLLIFLLIPITYFWYKTTSICPTDPIQLQHLQLIRNPQTSQFQVEKNKYFCNLCKTCIGSNSFHCKQCNRCVDCFDHHCKWVNNCIGSKNYIEFLHLLVWSWLFKILFFVWNGILIHRIINENQQLPTIFWYPVTMVALTLIPFIALSLLVFLHAYLLIAKRTTLNIILQSRKKNKVCPQNSAQALQYKNKSIIIPEQSQITSPANFLSHSGLQQINDQHNQSLIKFMGKLTQNLKMTKKPSQEPKQQNQASQTQKKINFKPTILKKNTDLQKNQPKINTVKNIKIGIQFQQVSDQKENTFQSSSKNYNTFEDSSLVQFSQKKNISQRKSSSKAEILTESVRQKHEKQNDTEKQNHFSETMKSSLKKVRNPKILQSGKKVNTQKKIKFFTNDNNSDFDDQNFKQQKSQRIKKEKQKQDCSIKRNNTFSERYQEGNKIQQTRIFKVGSSLQEAFQN